MSGGFPDGASGKEPACQCRRHERRRFNPWVGKIPWRRKWQPFQYSCLEYPMNRGSWLAQSMRSHRVGHNWVTKHRDAWNCAQNTENAQHMLAVVNSSIFTGSDTNCLSENSSKTVSPGVVMTGDAVPSLPYTHPACCCFPLKGLPVLKDPASKTASQSVKLGHTSGSLWGWQADSPLTGMESFLLFNKRELEKVFWGKVTH